MQNALLLELIRANLTGRGLAVCTNREVPTNDGGISLDVDAERKSTFIPNLIGTIQI